mgnify:CR=1 FL=1
MTRYTSDSVLIYYAGTNIPINKLEIKDTEKLQKYEQKLLLGGYQYFHNSMTEDTIFDEVYFIELHKKTFSELYDFAGQYRNVNISKAGSTFCQARFLSEQSKEIFGKFARENYLRSFHNKPVSEFANRIAYFMCELIALHPFIELNGRTIRLFFDMIAIYNGYEYIDYHSTLTQNDNDNLYIKASVECMFCNYADMERIILAGLTKSN